MRRMLAIVGVLALANAAPAAGLLIPKEKAVPPLAMLNHNVSVSIDDQVATTKIEQTFRNHTDRNLEAKYVFPVPKGANVKDFYVWVNGTKIKGEVVEAAKARALYTDIVSRTQDPALLEYIGNDLVQLQLFTVKSKSDQKVSVSYTSIALAENNLVEYIYPLKTDGKAITTLKEFSVNVDIVSQHPIQNIYSPSHGISIQRPSDKTAKIGFEKDQAMLDRNFQLFYTAGTKDVGLTAITHRPTSSQNGYFMMLVSPRAELSKDQQVPRDMVFVLDTSGSMRGKRMTQARNAMKYCLSNLGANDRFACINFATTVNRYTDQLMPAGKDDVERAKKWVDGLEATGGTAIDEALTQALNFRTKDEGRTFTVVFFTDGRPTIGETNTDKILANFAKRNTSTTRCFTFGVGDDVNATMLDKLADDSRALATYVRESEDIEMRVSSLFSKISNPVLANLKLTTSPGVSLAEMYPPQLPDLFHGTQLVVFGRYSGDGHAAIKITGSVGKETREFVYELKFPTKTMDEKNFVEDLWARRKVGYLLDQIRLNGEKKELVEEVVNLSKRYGITTPYTSYLIVPDGPGIVGPKKDGVPNVSFTVGSATAPPAALQNGSGAKPTSVVDFVKATQKNKGEGFGGRGGFAARQFDMVDDKDAKGDRGKLLQQQAKAQWNAYNMAYGNFRSGNKEANQVGTLGVDLSCANYGLRNQCQMTQTATRWVGGRNCVEIGGVWIDETYEAKMATVQVKAMSPAYFKILERHPDAKKVFQISNHLVWVTPSQTAMVVDANNGVETMSDADIDKLFKAPPKK